MELKQTSSHVWPFKVRWLTGLYFLTILFIKTGNYVWVLFCLSVLFCFRAIVTFLGKIWNGLQWPCTKYGIKNGWRDRHPFAVAIHKLVALATTRHVLFIKKRFQQWHYVHSLPLHQIYTQLTFMWTKLEPQSWWNIFPANHNLVLNHKGQNVHSIRLPLWQTERSGGDVVWGWWTETPKPQPPSKKNKPVSFESQLVHCTPLTSGSFPFRSSFGHIVPPSWDQADLWHMRWPKCSVALATNPAAFGPWSLVSWEADALTTDGL